VLLLLAMTLIYIMPGQQLGMVYGQPMQAQQPGMMYEQPTQVVQGVSMMPHGKGQLRTMPKQQQHQKVSE